MSEQSPSNTITAAIAFDHGENTIENVYSHLYIEENRARVTIRHVIDHAARGWWWPLLTLASSLILSAITNGFRDFAGIQDYAWQGIFYIAIGGSLAGAIVLFIKDRRSADRRPEQLTETIVDALIRNCGMVIRPKVDGPLIVDPPTRDHQVPQEDQPSAEL